MKMIGALIAMGAIALVSVAPASGSPARSVSPSLYRCLSLNCGKPYRCLALHCDRPIRPLRRS